ncbi:MAG: magnesium chelatase subunit D family protein [Cutibacterium avidum]|uniref:magnesium chelatase subunit D family protein n=1 Tax=Cutibacterium avidum TaxID=33010 RepID=UPI0022E8B69C|nr:magnesium chelatase subunit D family protein [Cutibacterium avidum]MBS5744838.1 magnesium chelatase subunit D family protein [Propionibacterium sp.]MDK7359891.1 magnesium chelatase subunit D family protein [Cutibacterium avidum]MDK7372574.1 magnesium chelatase subunit D family protein [Cutibacterium avidum]MDU3220099.1 magnesium chelatase subunit D family protein [Cutibacterium avidum]MDU3726311.1 magnesium chelatase subunit D family protein [Cutibacterium avidum]
MTYPFTAIVRQDETKLALLLCAVNPRIGGVVLSGEKGTAKSTVVRGLAELLPSQVMRTLALGATEDRLVGGLDLEATLTSGRPVLQPGLLSEVDGGVLYVDEVNLLDDHLVDLVIDACAGTFRVEREGLTATLASRFVLVGTMNPEEGALRPQLLDRFGLCVEVHGESDPDTRAEIIRRRLDHDADPSGFARRWQDDQERQAAAIGRAQRIVDQIALNRTVTELIGSLCRHNHVAGHRADIVMAEATRAHAALAGRGIATEDDVLAVSEMVLRHRRRDETPSAPTRPPEPQQQEQSEDQQPNQPDHQSDQPDRDPNDDVENRFQNEDAAPPPGSQDDQQRDDHADPDDQTDQTNQQPNPGEQVAAVGDPFAIRPLEPGQDRLARRASGRRLRTRSKDRRGRYISARPTTVPDDLALDATLRAAAVHQRSRRADPSRPAMAVHVEPGDWRAKVRTGRSASCVTLVVDASGSMGSRGRMTASKGAILSLLLDAYVKRDRVCLIGFRRDRAEVLVPVTSSVEVAQRGLAELPVGGRTPLAAGLVTACEVVRPLLLKDPGLRPLLVLVTDGRSNVGLDGKPNSRATDEALKVADEIGADRRLSWVVIDTEDPRGIQLSRANDIATALGGPCLRIDDLRADDLVNVVSQLDPTQPRKDR